jgi:nitrite reductase/ring-hydroxylating ferredoxin subunit
MKRTKIPPGITVLADGTVVPVKRRSVANVAARLHPGQVAAAIDGGKEVAVARIANGTFFVVEDLCPHDGGRLSDGYVEGDMIICSRHNWEFDLNTGICPHRPTKKIAVYESAAIQCIVRR